MAAGRWHVVLGWSMVMPPWLARNVVDTGNPVYPLGYRVFGGGLWNEAREAQWQHAHGPKGGDAEVRWAIRLSTWQAGRTGNRPFTWPLRPLALLRAGTQETGAGGGRIRGLSLSYVVAADAPARPVLAADAAVPGDPGRPRRRLVRVGWSWQDSPRDVILAIALVCNFVDCSTASDRPQRVDGKPDLPAPRPSAQAQSSPCRDRRRAAA